MGSAIIFTRWNMIASKIIRSCLEELKSISKVDLACFDIDGTLSAGTSEDFDVKAVNIRSFIDSNADPRLLGAIICSG